MTDNKDICDDLIKKIFGSNFYFAHGTLGANRFKNIIKSGEIHSSSKVPKENWRWDYENEPSTYIYCVGIYDDFTIDAGECYAGGPYSFFIDPRILFDEDVIFNTQWMGKPIEKQPTRNFFSIYLNKADTKKERLNKLTQIKNYVTEYVSLARSYCFMHEFLFPKSININKYVIGVMIEDEKDVDLHLKDYKKALKILKKKYQHIKIYKRPVGAIKNIYFPKLMDIVCN